MGGDIGLIDRREAAALLEWWLDAGVDTAIAEAPREWLAPPAGSRPAAPSAPAPDSMPGDLAAFRGWLGTASGLPLDRPGARRVVPEGAAEPELMVIAGPASADESGRPIGGEAWELARKMLAAIGLEPGQAYVAGLSCFAVAGARLDGPEAARCADIARHHVALVRPKRLLLLGDEVARAMLGGPVARVRGKVHKVEGVRAVATFAPRWLLDRPGDKALAWRDLLLLMDEE